MNDRVVELIVAGERLADAARNINVCTPPLMSERSRKLDEAVEAWSRARREAIVPGFTESEDDSDE